MVPIPSPPVIALLTDMGHGDWFVGTMKGVLLSICPRAHLVDICHEVRKQGIQEGAFMLRIAYSFFPPGTIFLCVVDPAVGSDRQPLVVRSDRYWFVAPDNGLLTFVQAESREWEGRAISNPALQLQATSTTFHGRDVFSPAAAHLAVGTPFEDFGPPVGEFSAIPGIEPVAVRGNTLSGHVIHIDSYGNLMTNVTPGMLPPEVDLRSIRLRFQGHLIQGIVTHYSVVPVNHPLMYWGSSGFLEIAINYGSAARKWGVQPNEWFEMEW